MEFEIQEHVESLPLQCLDETGPRGGEELLANLDATERRVEPPRELDRRGSAWEVEGDDDGRSDHEAGARSSLRSGE